MHPELFELKALVLGRLDAHRRREIDDHLGRCAECSRHYVAMMLGTASPKTAEAEAREAVAQTRRGAAMAFAGAVSEPPSTMAYGIDAPIMPSAPAPAPVTRAIPKPAAVPADLPPSSARTQVPVSASLVDAITRLRAESDAQAQASFAAPAEPAPVTRHTDAAPPAPLKPPTMWSDGPGAVETAPARPVAAINKVLPLGPRASAAEAPAPVAAPALAPAAPSFSFAEFDDFETPASAPPAPQAIAAPAVAAPVAQPVSVPVPAPASAPAKPELVVTFNAPNTRTPLRTAGLKPTAAFIPTLGHHNTVSPVAVEAVDTPLQEFHVPPARAGMPQARMAAIFGGVAAAVVIGVSGYRYFQNSVSSAAAAAAAAAAKQVAAAAQARAAQAPVAAPVAPSPAPVETRVVYVREPAKPEKPSAAKPDTQVAAPVTPVAVILPDVNIGSPAPSENALLSASQRSATSELTRSARATSSRTVSRP